MIEKKKKKVAVKKKRDGRHSASLHEPSLRCGVFPCYGQLGAPEPRVGRAHSGAAVGCSDCRGSGSLPAGRVVQLLFPVRPRNAQKPVKRQRRVRCAHFPRMMRLMQPPVHTRMMKPAMNPIHKTICEQKEAQHLHRHVPPVRNRVVQLRVSLELKVEPGDCHDRSVRE